MSLTLASVPVKSDTMIFRKIEDEYILVPMLASAAEVQHIFNLDPVGAAVWELIDGRRSVGEIVAALAGEFEAEPGVIEAEVVEFLNELAAEKIVGAA